MADFDKALMKVLRHEGVEFNAAGSPVPGRTGYVYHRDDPGGETNYGVTRKTARNFGYLGSMLTIPYAIVRTIYKQQYWNKLRGDDIPDQQIAEELMDTAVNCGVELTVKFLQRTLNVLNKQGILYADIAVDGACGPKTVETLKRCLAVQPWYRDCVLRALDSLQCVRYVELAETNKKFQTFLPGWLRIRVGGY